MQTFLQTVNERNFMMNPLNTIIPTVVEGNGGMERAYDIYSLLLKERIVFVGSQIDSQIANLVVAQLLYLSREDPERDIQMYIQSPGGSVYAGLAIYDTMQMIPNRINTVACGFTAVRKDRLPISRSRQKRSCVSRRI